MPSPLTCRSTKLGVYKEHAGLDTVHMSWGHDEYGATLQC